MSSLKKLALLSLLLLASFSLFSQTKELTLKDVWGSRDLFPKRPDDLQSLKDGEHYVLMKSDSLIEYDYITGTAGRVFFKQSDFIRKEKNDTLQLMDFSFSNDESKIVFNTEMERIYRRSSKSNYFVMDLTSKKITSISEGGKQRLADFSPDATKVAFVRDNNLFITDLSNGKETQVTMDGKQNAIINGATDWVYEEEFEFSKGFYWSPDGSKIAFYRFDESNVKEFTMTKFGGLYPEEYKFKYPKAGEANSLISIYIYDLNAKTIKPVDIGKETDIYIPRIKWTNLPNTLSLYRMNRHQNKLELLFADANSGKTNVVYTEENKYYIEINDNLTFTKDNKYFLISSERDGNKHLYLYGMDGKQIFQLTHGNWEVDELLGVDETKRVIFFTTTESGPMFRDICCINMDGTRKKNISKQRGWNVAEFSKNFKYYVQTWQDANTPPVYTLKDIKGKELRVLEDNAKLRLKTKEFGFGKLSFFTIPLQNGTVLNAYVIKPLNFDSTKKYPVWMNLYGGPGSQSVQDRWGYYDFIWYQMLAQQGILSICVDNRGTGARGEEFKKCTYQELGKLETEDQIASAKYIATLPFVDGKRIGIWGWSYGGFMSSLCMLKGDGTFKAGIAVAPVTNWRYYDNIYTERYMRTPQENPKGYDDNSPMNFAKGLQGKFLLVHGTGDDNVHFQNSVELVNALVKANKQFESFYYPNRNHGISGGNTRMHLYKMLTDFIQQNL
ncbi:MAG: S9 family peptidase [Bacteroidota bacterium]